MVLQLNISPRRYKRGKCRLFSPFLRKGVNILNTKDKLFMGGIICVVALLGFIAGAIVSGGQAFAGIPSSLQDDVMAYKDDVAYIALDRVDHITIHMKDGSGTESDINTDSSSSPIAEVQVAELESTAPEGSAPPKVRESVTVQNNDADYRSAPTSSAGSGQTVASDMEGIPAPPPALLSSGGGTQVAAAATSAKPNITINNTLPESNIVVQPTPVVVQSQPSSVYTVNNYTSYSEQLTQVINDIVDNSTNLVNSSLNTGTQVSVDYQVVLNDILNALENDQDFAEEVLQMAGLTIDVTTVNNANNSGVILQDSDNNSIVDLDDVILNVEADIQNSFNEDSFNTEMENVGNTTLENVGNTTDIDLTNIINENCGNDIDLDFDNVGNDSFQETINATLNEIDTDIQDSFNDADLVNYNDSDGVDIDDNDGMDVDVSFDADSGSDDSGSDSGSDPEV